MLLSATLKIFTWGSWSEMLCGLLPVSLESAYFISLPPTVFTRFYCLPSL